MYTEHPIRLYIADDQEDCLATLKLAVEDAPDIRIAGVANNGKKLLDLMAGELPDVIIADIHMDIMDGITMTQHIKKEYPFIKIIGFTQYTDERLFIEMMHAGADGYLYKTADSRAIICAIRKVYADCNYFCTKTLQKMAQLLQQGIFRLSARPLRADFFTGKEKDVLLLLCEGLSGKEIAAKAGISLHTVNKYRANLRAKTGRTNDAMLVLFAIQQGLFNPEKR